MSESEFACYGPYCANYLDAITMVNEQMPNLLVSPCQRIMPDLSAAKTYPWQNSLVFILSVNSRRS